MMTVMMTVVSVAYWRWNSRVTEKNVSFRSEVFTLAQQPELKEEDIPVLHQLNEEYSRVARLVERVLVSIDTTGVTSVPQPSEDGDFMIEKRLTVHGLGSGVIVTEEGHIITAYHVIQNKHALRVTLSNGKSVSVRLVGVDPELLPMILVGMAVSAVVGYFAIRLVNLLTDKGKFGNFAYYCWGVGVLALILSILL